MGGRIANIGVHRKPVQLHLEKLWDRNIALTTRLFDASRQFEAGCTMSSNQTRWIGMSTAEPDRQRRAAQNERREQGGDDDDEPI